MIQNNWKPKELGRKQVKLWCQQSALCLLTPLSARASAGTVKTNLYFRFYTGPTLERVKHHTGGHCPDNTLSHIMARGKNWSMSENRTHSWMQCTNFNKVLMSTIASQITSLAIVYSTVYSGTDERKHQSSASLACVGNSPLTGEFPAQRASNAENVSIWWKQLHCYINPNFLHQAPQDTTNVISTFML